MTGVILLYGFEELGEILAVQSAAAPLGAQVRPVWRDGWRAPVGELAAGASPAGGAVSGPFGGRMLVFCGLDGRLDGLLSALRSAGIGSECYKAVLTAHNRTWDGLTLLAELQRERRNLSAGEKGGRRK